MLPDNPLPCPPEPWLPAPKMCLRVDAFQDREISSRIRKVALVWLDENWFNRSLPMVARAFFPKADEAEKERIILRSFDWLSLAHPSTKRGKKAEPKGLVSGLLSKLGLKS